MVDFAIVQFFLYSEMWLNCAWQIKIALFKFLPAVFDKNCRK